MKDKRRVFCDAVDLLAPEAPEGGVKMLPVDAIKPFHEHPFKIYQGDRLEDMVESIREHGILTPVIVRKLGTEYEMLAGHNRQNAARMAGLSEIPAIVKENLSDEEAWIYVVETNVIQRSFNDLSISERITVLSARYDKVCGTKKREEILEELHVLNGDVGGHDVHQAAKSRELIGQEYGMTGRNIARYVRCGQLIQGFKDMLDDGSLALVVGVELSYLSEEEQKLVKAVVDQNCISIKNDMAKKLRAAAGSITEESVQVLMGVDKPVEAAEIIKPISVKIPAKVYIATAEERREEAYFETVRSVIVKIVRPGPLSLKDINKQVNELLKQSVQSDGVINLFTDVDKEFNLFNSAFMQEIAKMPEKNLSIELLKKLIAEQVHQYKRTNIVKSQQFSEMLDRIVKSYLNGMLTNEQVIEELMNMAVDISEAHKKGNEMGLSDEELAFYDALTKPQAVKDFYTNEELISITKELTEALRQSRTVDWEKKESARAGMRRMVKRLLKKYKYPPDGVEDAVKTVIGQCELWVDNGDTAEGTANRMAAYFSKMSENK